MPVIKNVRHEMFAQSLAQGKNQTDAYTEAGYKTDRAAASRLSTKLNIQARVAEIQNRSAMRTEVTVASITERLLAIAEKGEVSKDAPLLSVARGALMDAAKLNGLVVDTVEKLTLTPEQRQTRIKALEARKRELLAGYRDGTSIPEGSGASRH